MRIAVDAMGGDRAPGALVEGAVAAARELGVGVTLVGDRAALASWLARLPAAASADVRVVDAPSVVGMDESPAVALRRKPGASVRVALDEVAAGRADGCFTAGHTGAALVAAHGALGVLSGVERPALAATIPTRSGAAVLIDVGANVVCRPTHLVQFGFMGSAFARVVLDVSDPRVGLLSIGEEESKGTDLTREAHRLCKASALNFVGNVEARDVYAGKVDVIVCDGFTGNVALKVSEGLAEMMQFLASAEVEASWRTRVGWWLCAPALQRFRSRLDPAEYGGVPLLGIAGVCVVGHGRSNARAVKNGIGVAVRCVREDWTAELTNALVADRARAEHCIVTKGTERQES